MSGYRRYAVDNVDGDLSDFIDALIADNETTRLATLEE